MLSNSLHIHRNARALWMLALFLVVVLATGLFIGTQSPPGEWYQNLQKPVFNPPDWIFPPVWTVLYIFIAVAGWRTFRTAPRSAAMVLWALQMLLNWIWSPVFFTLHMVWPALAIIVLLLLTILAFTRDRWHHDRPAALLFSAYAAWVGFAAVLNGAIAFLN
ncbi:MAG: tryptophan-rich sensory protein [Roseibium sp.]|uniref:TspO/MBR family protein n=1 Tax=Roseibium sp. TaxID=1936156 RepID=UPI002609B886|nr:TspO/MBR family protein [Roseibium sp.]MCV0424838.1 tryptophan-rich sensory protein [Roseibium sp.]